MLIPGGNVVIPVYYMVQPNEMYTVTVVKFKIKFRKIKGEREREGMEREDKKKSLLSVTDIKKFGSSCL